MKNNVMEFHNGKVSGKKLFRRSNAKLFLLELLGLMLLFLLSRNLLGEEGSFDLRILKLGAGLIVVTFLSTILVSRLTTGDPYLLMITHLLFFVGILMIYRIVPSLGIRQMLFFFVGIALYFVTYFFLKATRHIWEKRLLLFYLLTLGLLLVTMVFGFVQNGAKNWVSIAGFTVQPSEFAKIPFVLFVAGWYRNYERYETMRYGKLTLMAAVYLLIGLFFLQRELGTAIVFFAVLSGSQIAFERNKKLILVNILFAVLGLVLAYFLFSHIRLRFAVWKDPWADPKNSGYQIIQSLIAAAEGGLFGTGIGLGRPDLIPVGHSDFIFAAILEEMGAFMGIAIVLLYIILIYRGFKIAIAQERDYYSALALCISVLFAAQSFIMFAGVMKVIPLTGITIPFMTYGGSSLISSYLLLAMLQVCSENLTERRS